MGPRRKEAISPEEVKFGKFEHVVSVTLKSKRFEEDFIAFSSRFFPTKHHGQIVSETILMLINLFAPNIFNPESLWLRSNILSATKCLRGGLHWTPSKYSAKYPTKYPQNISVLDRCNNHVVIRDIFFNIWLHSFISEELTTWATVDTGTYPKIILQVDSRVQSVAIWTMLYLCSVEYVATCKSLIFVTVQTETHSDQAKQAFFVPLERPPKIESSWLWLPRRSRGSYCK